MRCRAFFLFFVFCIVSNVCHSQNDNRPPNGTRAYNLAGTDVTPGRRRSPASVEDEDVGPAAYGYSVGFEGAPAPTVLPQSAVAFGWWLNPSWGVETYFGFNKGSDDSTAASATATNTLARTQTITTTYTPRS